MKAGLAVLAAVVVLTAALRAQSFNAFGPRPSVDVDVAALSDQEVTGLLGTLDRLLAEAPAAAWRDRAADALTQFTRRIQTARISRAQETRVLTHLDGIGRSRPDAAAVVAGPRKKISSFTVGKTAPEIIGKDLDGRPLKLSEYRGKVVLVVFTADWCAICRAQAPYERFLIDKYARWPFAILGVETGSSREAARQAHAAGPLSHRSWWDEPRAEGTGGPIADAWGVVGWPATYLIDGDGVIQHVDLREESLLIAVRQLLEVQVDRATKTKSRR